MIPKSPKLLDKVRYRIRVKGYSIRMEKSYTSWIKRYIYFHGKRHPQEMGKPEIESFLSHLGAINNGLQVEVSQFNYIRGKQRGAKHQNKYANEYGFTHSHVYTPCTNLAQSAAPFQAISLHARIPRRSTGRSPCARRIYQNIPMENCKLLLSSPGFGSRLYPHSIRIGPMGENHLIPPPTSFFRLSKVISEISR